MARFTLILATLASLSAANLMGFYVQRGLYEGDDQKALSVTCNSFQVACGDYCIPKTAECCSPDVGSYCAASKSCISGGCCPNGETCSGDTSRCEPEFELHDTSSCIPEGSVLCGDGTYCEAGDTCTYRGTCATNNDVGNLLMPRKGSGKGSSSGGGSSRNSTSGAVSLNSPSLLGVALVVGLLVL